MVRKGVAVWFFGCLTFLAGLHALDGFLWLTGTEDASLFLSVYPFADLLGEVDCLCFKLTSDGQTLTVWYGSMVEDNGTVQPTVSIQGIENGDWVVVTGELKQSGIHHSLNDYWSSSIEKVE